MKLLLLQGTINAANEAAENISEESKEVTVSILDLLMEGGWYIMIPLALLSIIAIYIFFERTFAITKALKEEKDFMNKIKDYIHDGKLDSAKNLCSTSHTPIARMLGKGIARIGKPLKDISASIENVGKLEIYSLEKNLSLLATIAGVAPMIGFLGTVIGMVQVFVQMEVAGSVEVQDISAGTKQAMVTTIVGLIVGIIAYMAYNYLVGKVSKVIHKMEASSIEFIDILEEPGK
ncbi:MAG: MotA/TolQ/ExbB proton channel family protein [Flavobacteriales bacterium]|nr:MotA/TolQ/ExbB proton channel family protein [Flavobacteriales bacterium]MDG1767306.1 MotA/TolQ/ExbB proton channel family protein [Flavobacteriales bacterium]